MTYNKSNISKHKGRLVEITYKVSKNSLKYENSLVCEITANTKEHVIFNVNKNEEIFLRYNQIIKITNPKKDEN